MSQQSEGGDIRGIIVRHVVTAGRSLDDSLAHRAALPLLSLSKAEYLAIKIYSSESSPGAATPVSCFATAGARATSAVTTTLAPTEYEAEELQKDDLGVSATSLV
jgi:hypothetical protein